MKEIIIFLIFFLVIFSVSIFIFNGRFIYAQIKYSFLGTPLASESNSVSKQNNNKLNPQIQQKENFYPDKLIISSLNIEVPVVITESDNEVYLQKALEKGVIYLPGSSALNENGTAVIMGHSSAYPWYKGQYGSIFALLNKLNINDEITIFSKNKKFTYYVTDKQIKAPKDLVFEIQKDAAVLYLVSCWPINTAWKRIVIKTAQALDKNY